MRHFILRFKIILILIFDRYIETDEQCWDLESANGDDISIFFNEKELKK